jgi:hypothetical protein
VLNTGIYKFRSCGHKYDEAVNMMWRHFVSLYVKMVIDQKERRKREEKTAILLKMEKRDLLCRVLEATSVGILVSDFPFPFLGKFCLLSVPPLVFVSKCLTQGYRGHGERVIKLSHVQACIVGLVKSRPMDLSRF